MELLAILGPIFLFVLIKGALDQRAKERQARLAMLEQALKNPVIDRATVTALAQQLTGAKPPVDRSNKPSRGLAFLLALGWLTLFAGLGLLALGFLLGQEGVTAAGGLVSVIGFGLVTYPFALRELEARRPAA